MYDVNKIRRDFPILSEKINSKRNCFLDTAASAQKPACVIQKMNQIYEKTYANVHRGAYHLSEIITSEYENARKIVHSFINSKSASEVIFTRNATESINLVASTWGRKNLEKGDEVLISEAEHHANIVPWQVLRGELGITLKVFSLNEDGGFNFESFSKELSSKTKLVSVTAQSNVLGTIYPIKDVILAAHNHGAKVLIDACQYAVHHKLDVQELDCDFLVFSAHKTYGPSGIGVLYGKKDILEEIPPYQYGGDMVDNVTFEKTTFAKAPAKFEAGTPAIVEAIGFGEALKYMQSIGMDNIEAYEKELVQYALQKLSAVEGLKIIGPQTNRGGVFSFQLGNIHASDLAFILDKEGVSVRTGHHCAQPIVNRFGYNSVARASLGLYSDKEDIDQLVSALNKARTFF